MPHDLPLSDLHLHPQHHQHHHHQQLCIADKGLSIALAPLTEQTAYLCSSAGEKQNCIALFFRRGKPESVRSLQLSVPWTSWLTFSELAGGGSK